MPWKECSVVEERLRFVARLLDGEAMTELCREFGISRKTGYKIFDRYKEHGLEVHLICDAVQVFDYVSFSPNRDYRFVDAVAVLPRVQRQGLGTQMSQRRNPCGGTVHEWQRGYRETGRCDEGSFSRVIYSKETAPRWRDCPLAHASP